MEVMKSERFKRNYKSREGFNNLVRRMWDSFDYNIGNMQYAEDGRGNQGIGSVFTGYSRGNVSEQSERSGGADAGKSIADNAEQKSRVIYTIR